MAPKPAKRLPQRGSVRGAFGPAGALSVGGERRRSSDQLCRAQIFQLDRCLDAKEFNKIIYQFGSTAEARQQASTTSVDDVLTYDVQGFVAQFDALDTDHSGSLTLAEFSPEKVQEELKRKREDVSDEPLDEPLRSEVRVVEVKHTR